MKESVGSALGKRLPFAILTPTPGGLEEGPANVQAPVHTAKTKHSEFLDTDDKTLSQEQGPSECVVHVTTQVTRL